MKASNQVIADTCASGQSWYVSMREKIVYEIAVQPKIKELLN